jgi:hypothetical protein
MRPFQNSLEALAQVAVRATGARSYAFFEKGGFEHGGFEKDGAAWTDAGRPPLVEYEVGVRTLAFAFGSDAEALRARPRLDRIAAAIQTIWAAAAVDRYTHLVDRVSDLESRLMDSKIADRVRGFLTDESNPNAAEAIARHLDSVLRPTPTTRFLEQTLSQLEIEIEERHLMTQAKQVLQTLHRLSEEQAHHRLRLLSRKSRKPLKDVARQVIDDQYLPKGKTA